MEITSQGCFKVPIITCVTPPSRINNNQNSQNDNSNKPATATSSYSLSSSLTSSPSSSSSSFSSSSSSTFSAPKAPAPKSNREPKVFYLETTPKAPDNKLIGTFRTQINNAVTRNLSGSSRHQRTEKSSTAGERPLQLVGHKSPAAMEYYAKQRKKAREVEAAKQRGYTSYTSRRSVAGTTSNPNPGSFDRSTGIYIGSTGTYIGNANAALSNRNSDIDGAPQSKRPRTATAIEPKEEPDDDDTVTRQLFEPKQGPRTSSGTSTMSAPIRKRVLDESLASPAAAAGVHHRPITTARDLDGSAYLQRTALTTNLQTPPTAINLPPVTAKNSSSVEASPSHKHRPVTTTAIEPKSEPEDDDAEQQSGLQKYSKNLQPAAALFASATATEVQQRTVATTNLQAPPTAINFEAPFATTSKSSSVDASLSKRTRSETAPSPAIAIVPKEEPIDDDTVTQKLPVPKQGPSLSSETITISAPNQKLVLNESLASPAAAASFAVAASEPSTSGRIITPFNINAVASKRIIDAMIASAQKRVLETRLAAASAAPAAAATGVHHHPNTTAINLAGPANLQQRTTVYQITPSATSTNLQQIPSTATSGIYIGSTDTALSNRNIAKANRFSSLVGARGVSFSKRRARAPAAKEVRHPISEKIQSMVFARTGHLLNLSTSLSTSASPPSSKPTNIVLSQMTGKLFQKLVSASAGNVDRLLSALKQKLTLAEMKAAARQSGQPVYFRMRIEAPCNQGATTTNVEPSPEEPAAEAADENDALSELKKDPLYTPTLVMANTILNMDEDVACWCSNCLINWQLDPMQMQERWVMRDIKKMEAETAKNRTTVEAPAETTASISTAATEQSQKPDEVRILGFACHHVECQLICPGPNKNELYKHMKTVHGTTPFRCLLGCPEDFLPPSAINKHVETAHASQTAFPCGQCPQLEPFSSYNDLRKHHRHEHEMGEFACSWPDHHETFRFRVEAYAHIKRIHLRNGRDNPEKMAARQKKLQSTNPITSTEEALAEVLQNMRDFVSPTPEEEAAAKMTAAAAMARKPGYGGNIGDLCDANGVSYALYRTQEEFERQAAKYPPPIPVVEMHRMVMAAGRIPTNRDREFENEEGGGGGAPAAAGPSTAYACRWPSCRKRCRFAWNLRTHIRTKHFKLPKTKRLMQAVNLDVEKVDEVEENYVFVYEET